MAWETRCNGRYSYYYRKRRKGSKVLSEYASQWGTGSYAERRDQEARHAKQRQRATLQRFCDEQRQIDQDVNSYGQQVRQVVVVVLTILGFHQHKGQWRKRRGDMDIQARTEQYRQLLRAATVANDDDGPETHALQAYANANPDVFSQLGTVGDTVIVELVKKVTPDKASEIGLTGELRLLYKRLGGDTATALEQLLIRDVIVCHLRVQMAEQEYTQYSWLAASTNLAKAAFLEQRLSATRRRYLQAVESLARVRRLLSRADVQINLAQQMVVQNSGGTNTI